MNTIKISHLVELIVSKLDVKCGTLKVLFQDSKKEIGFSYAFIDDLLPNDIANQIAVSFPDHKEMRHMNSIRENKYTSKSFDRFDPLLRNITFAIQAPDVISVINRITGIQGQIPDPTLYAGGLSMMPRGCFLNPHIDNSHDGKRENYRTLNLLYYATVDWKEEYGGNLELWDSKVKNKVTIHSKFNRLVLMETNPWSWHSVSKVKVDHSRNCVSNYYFSKISPIGKNYFNVTSYSARPEEWLKASLFKTDNLIRSSLRKIFPKGLGKKDVYQSAIK